MTSAVETRAPWNAYEVADWRAQQWTIAIEQLDRQRGEGNSDLLQRARPLCRVVSYNKTSPNSLVGNMSPINGERVSKSTWRWRNALNAGATIALRGH